MKTIKVFFNTNDGNKIIDSILNKTNEEASGL